MQNNKDTGDNKETKQAPQKQETAINPFSQAAPQENTQPSREEEIELEQKRKEALTERD